tara:strand:- start:370 stop:834 length:465 start_codon:yes stop_codon:yes gene_type:complete
MKNFDLKKYLAENKLIKEGLVDKIKQVRDYDETEDSLDYKEYFITYDGDENIYSVFLKKGDNDSSDIPDFESSNPNAVEDFLLKKDLSEGKLLKENEDGSQHHIDQIDDDLLNGEFDSYEDVVGYLDNIIVGIEELKIQQKQVFQDMGNDEYEL